MKANAILGLLFFIGALSLSAQTITDSIQMSEVYPKFHDSFTAEESWEIHKEAYIKQLKSKNLSEREIKNKLKAYDKNKADFIQNIIEVRTQAQKQRLIAEKQRKQAEILRSKAEVQRAEANELRKAATEQRKRSEVMVARLDEQRKKVEVQREKAEQQRARAAIQREQANELRKMAELQRKEALVMRNQAQILLDKAEKLRNSIDVIVSEKVRLNSSKTDISPVIFDVDFDDQLSINLQGKLTSGKVRMELLNPKNLLEAELIIDYDSSVDPSDKLTIVQSKSGSISKTIDNASKGKWQLKIVPTEAKGSLSYSFARFKDPETDD